MEGHLAWTAYAALGAAAEAVALACQAFPCLEHHTVPWAAAEGQTWLEPQQVLLVDVQGTAEVAESGAAVVDLAGRSSSCRLEVRILACCRAEAVEI